MDDDKREKKCYTYNEALWLRRALVLFRSFPKIVRWIRCKELWALVIYGLRLCLPSHVLHNIVHKYNDANRYIELEHTTQKYTPIKTKLGYFNEV